MYILFLDDIMRFLRTRTFKGPMMETHLTLSDKNKGFVQSERI